jgi:hypothetical protein
MSSSDLTHLQIKFTYVGPRKGGYPSFAFTTRKETINASEFAPYYRAAYDYDEDDYLIGAFTATNSEMHAIVRNVGRIETVRKGLVESGGNISFSMLNRIRGVTRCFEAIVSWKTGSEIVRQIDLALPNNPAGRAKLGSYAWALGISPQGTSR